MIIDITFDFNKPSYATDFWDKADFFDEEIDRMHKINMIDNVTAEALRNELQQSIAKYLEDNNIKTSF